MTYQVYRFVVGGGHEPCSDAAAVGPVGTGVLPQRDKDILDDVLGVAAVKGDAIGHRVHGGVVTVEDLSQSSVVALRQRVCQPGIGAWRARCIKAVPGVPPK